MPAIPKSGLLPRNPFRPDSGQAIAPREIVESEPYHGLIDFTTPVAWLYTLAGHRLRRTRDKDGRVIYEKVPEARGAGEPREPPTPPRAGGPYAPFVPFNYESDKIPDSVFSRAYRNMLNYNLSRGRLVLDDADPSDELFRKWGTDACEYRFVGEDNREYQAIKISRDVGDIRERLKRLAHETKAADLFEGLPRYKGDHEEMEDEIKLGTDELAAKYIMDALRSDTSIHRN